MPQEQEQEQGQGQGQGQKQENATRWLVGSDSLQGERRFSVVYISPHSGIAPLPPGVRHWPEPGEAVPSPALLKAGAGEHIERRYGKPAGTIGQDGPEDPGEWLAYVRPAAELSSRQPTEIVTGFGPSAGSTAQGLEPGSGRADDRPEWMFLAAVTGLLLLPGFALLIAAMCLGSPTRQGGTPAWRPALLGTAAAALPVAAALLWDVRVPHTDYLLSSTDLRTYGWLLALGPVAGAVTGRRRPERRGDHRSDGFLPSPGPGIRSRAPDASVRRP
ncbi:hypothetical protein OG352_21800 [Streptomyces sp. NBC_01485]|uniref:hypothetical protein n=1 Tax=Streptomyces sp. NBC_01485 TaxID=2903884 RepID=UPI002E367DC9|nr:hypothetical protein [Streptomyces sp. NBC_01485]